jgi:hypothetical protein
VQNTRTGLALALAGQLLVVPHSAFFTLHSALQDYALFGLGFPAAPHHSCLTLPANATRRFILQKARHHKGLPPRSDCL